MERIVPSIGRHGIYRFGRFLAKSQVVFAKTWKTSYHFVKNFFPSRTVSDDPDGRVRETWKIPPARGRPSASHQMRRTISRGELRIKARKTFFIFNGKAVRKNFSSGKP